MTDELAALQPTPEDQAEIERLRAEIATFQRAQMPQKRALKVTSAEEFEAPFEESAKGELEELPSGRVVRIRKLGIVQELLAGTLPNRVLDQIIFGKDLRNVDPDDPKNADQVQRYVEGLVNIAVRAVTEPKVVIDRKPEPKKGEISQFSFTLPDLQHIRFVAVYERLAEVVETPPFPAGTDDSGESSASPLPE